jgi:hypothetical protein
VHPGAPGSSDRPAMLGGMDIPGAAAGTATVPWLVLVVVLGVLVVLLAGLTAALVVRRKPPGPPSAAPEAAPAGYREDDLPGFLESPPGSGAASVPRTGWAALTMPPAAAAAPSTVPAPRGRRDTVVVLSAMAGTALLLVGAAAAVAATSGPDGRRGQHERTQAAADGAAARLTFGGVVLEPRAVGVTATYPVVEMSADGDRASARVEFPTFNCLTDEAPEDPVAAGCTRSLTEYGALTSPDLVIERDGDGLRIIGGFPTEVRPNGSAPVPTGRVYELQITATPTDGEATRGWRPAEGVLELGSGRAVTVDLPGVSVLRSGS